MLRHKGKIIRISFVFFFVFIISLTKVGYAEKAEETEEPIISKELVNEELELKNNDEQKKLDNDTDATNVLELDLESLKFLKTDGMFNIEFSIFFEEGFELKGINFEFYNENNEVYILSNYNNLIQITESGYRISQSVPSITPDIYKLEKIQVLSNENNSIEYDLRTKDIQFEVYEEEVVNIEETISFDNSTMTIKVNEAATVELNKTYKGKTSYIIENSEDEIVSCKVNDDTADRTNIEIVGKKTGTAFIKFYSIDNPSINTTIEITVEAVKNGWLIENGAWHYYNQDKMLVNSWQKDSVGWYYLDSNGNTVKETFVSDSKGICYIGSDGYWTTSQGWKLDNTTNQWGYINQNGYGLKNALVKDSKGLCYIGSNGYWTTTEGWRQDSGTKQWAYIDKGGYALKNEWKIDSRGLCYIGSDGYWKVSEGWKINDNSKQWTYIGGNGYVMKNALIKDSSGLCYVGNDGYWIISEGWRQDSRTKQWAYIGKSGYALKNTWISHPRGLCYIGSNGYWITSEGWKLNNNTNQWVYIGKEGYTLKNALIKDSVGLCYLGNDGYWKTSEGWRQDSGTRQWAYIGKNGYALKDRLVTDSLGLCYLGSSGYWKTSEGWRQDSSTKQWAYIDNKGYALKDTWKRDSKGWCYLNNKGLWDSTNNVYPYAKTIMLDSGHGGSDPGAVNGSIYEKKLNSSLVTILANKLREKGMNVIFTRDPSADTFLSLEERTNKANNIKPDAFISIHHDAANVSGYSFHYSSYRPNIEFSGAYFIKGGKKHYVIREVSGRLYYIENNVEKSISIYDAITYDETPSSAAIKSKKLANELYNQMLNLDFIGPRGNPVQDHNLAVTRWTTMPSVLIEAGPTTSFMNNLERQNAIADRITKALENYFATN